MKAYITKYALFDGISEIDADEKYRRIYVPRWAEHILDGDWHRTLEAAQTRAEEMRQAKIASLKKQIAKLEKMNFN